ncbi:hypothetical protein [Pararhodobacter zhoushanensis]|uniref:hypothetical protein n=1 Tax=Pararhodobacter zhoushanensis TaxID=2479545 RepID=UPI000F8EB5BF|nr:hypothetical protein [Pararhodobacter zhoushanensis]
MEGIYAVYFTGSGGVGLAVLVMMDGIVTGSDEMGGSLDGTYSTSDSGRVSVSVVLKTSPGTTLATGQTMSSMHTQTIKIDLPAGFANGQSINMQTPLGPLTASFKKLRTLR